MEDTFLRHPRHPPILDRTPTATLLRKASTAWSTRPSNHGMEEPVSIDLTALRMHLNLNYVLPGRMAMIRPRIHLPRHSSRLVEPRAPKALPTSELAILRYVGFCDIFELNLILVRRSPMLDLTHNPLLVYTSFFSPFSSLLFRRTQLYWRQR
jgi:hypothetical protein